MATEPKVSQAQLADLADVILAIGQQLETRGPAARNVIPLTHAEINVMREVHRFPGATATEIARLTGTQRSNVSATVRRLEHEGLLAEVPPRNGARGVGFAPTALAEENLETLRQDWARRFAPVPEESLRLVVAQLPALEAIMRALESQ